MGIVATAVEPEWAKRLKTLTFDFAFEDVGPKVSILIPSRNNRDVLKRCVDLCADIPSQFRGDRHR
jgi:cellulose synthase/poly-beta-1,6-N-acetylglucosamine synthase-like glycosyltransferase